MRHVTRDRNSLSINYSHSWNINAAHFIGCHFDDCDAMHHLIMTIFSSLVEDYLVIGGDGHASGAEIHVELYAYSETTLPLLTVSLQTTQGTETISTTPLNS